MTISAVCPQELRIANRRHINPWRDSTEWHEKEIAFLSENPVCAYCGRPSEVAHHNEDWMYHDKGAYFDLENNATPACHSCHRQYKRGLEVCPVCKEKGEIHYMIRGRDKCSRHNGGTIYIRRIGRVKALHHPCKNNHGTQVCIRDGRKFLCGRSWKNAERCDHFIKREKEDV